MGDTHVKDICTFTDTPSISVCVYEKNMKTVHSFKQQIPDITGRYNSYILSKLASIFMHYISSTSDIWTLQTDTQAGSQCRRGLGLRTKGIQTGMYRLQMI